MVFIFMKICPRLVYRFHILLERVSSIYTSFIFTQSSEDAEFAVTHKFKKRDRILAIGNGVITDSFASSDLSLRHEFSLNTSLNLPT